MEEPVAAALAYSEAGLRVGNGILVYDLGGGTFDLAVVTRDENRSFQVAMETDGDPNCGGDDFDQALYDYWAEVLAQQHNRSLSLTDGTINLPFLRECRRRKETLSVWEHASFRSWVGGMSVPLEIDRTTFEGLIQPRIESTVRKTKSMLEQAQEARHHVDTVVLIGGSSELPLVRRWLEEVLPIAPYRTIFKDVAVAQGAAYYGRRLWLPPELPSRRPPEVPPPLPSKRPPPLPSKVPPPLPSERPPPLPQDR